jgi:hypothetical protein
MKNTLFIIFALITLQSCQRDNSKIYSAFENEFNDSIEKENGKKFDFECDGLTRQSSYFVNNKLKFMTLRIAGESVVLEYIIYFDENTGSISKNIIKRTEYEWDNAGNNIDRDNYSDTIYVFDYKQKKVKIFVENKIVSDAKAKSKLLENTKYILGIKECTEKQYNSR